ncbi:2-oxoacid:acceptor oxidoreductase subunit alpha [Archaeoglobales archaeon]|nr:MAG: 2-oxoacid:acceptor oxidoreductase subunit alpha [Archaeoglobales archaeon]
MDFCIAISGAAGDGVRRGGLLVAKLLSSLGYNTFVYQEYQSLIRGGHNASVIRFSDRKIHSHRYYYDLFVCLEDYVLDLHKDRIKGLIIHDSKFECSNGNTIPIPMTEFIKEEHKPIIYRNAIVLGVLCRLLGIRFEVLEELFRKEYDDAESDILLAEEGYDYVKEIEPILKVEKIGDAKEVYSGNDAIAIGMMRAGLRNYYAYPMTPASSILHFLAKQEDVIAVQPESEIAAIMMALGSAFAGKRAAVATSGGGFALMTESISLAAMAEIPVLVVEAQRSSPSTGMATYTAQQDLDFVIHPAHGEFPLILASPITVEDAFSMTAELLNLAWKYQTPAILLTDKHLSESYESIDGLNGSVTEEKIEVVERCEGIFKRYEVTNTGISKIAFPPNIVKANSNEHDEFGFTTDNPQIATEMYAKRMRKEVAIKEDIQKREPYKVFNHGKDCIITWGSTFGAVKDVAEELGYKLIAMRYLRPLIVPEIKGRVIVVECNYSGLLANKIENKLSREVERINRWDGRPFTPEELRERLRGD